MDIFKENIFTDDEILAIENIEQDFKAQTAKALKEHNEEITDAQTYIEKFLEIVNKTGQQKGKILQNAMKRHIKEKYQEGNEKAVKETFKAELLNKINTEHEQANENPGGILLFRNYIEEDENKNLYFEPLKFKEFLYFYFRVYFETFKGDPLEKELLEILDKIISEHSYILNIPGKKKKTGETMRYKNVFSTITTADTDMNNGLFGSQKITDDFNINLYDRRKKGKQKPPAQDRFIRILPTDEYFEELGAPELTLFSAKILDSICDMVLSKPDKKGKINLTMRQLVKKVTGNPKTTNINNNEGLAMTIYMELKAMTNIWIYDSLTGEEKMLLNINFIHSEKNILNTKINVLEQSPYLPIAIERRHTYKQKKDIFPPKLSKTAVNLTIMEYIKNQILFTNQAGICNIDYSEIVKNVKKYVGGTPRRGRIMDVVKEAIDHLEEINLFESSEEKTKKNKIEGYKCKINNKTKKEIFEIYYPESQKIKIEEKSVTKN